MKKVVLLLAMLLLLVVSACSGELLKKQYCFSASTESQKWQVTEIAGHTLKLIDKTAYELLSFSDHNNVVLAEVGTIHGAIAGPAWYWEIDRDGILIIKEWDGKALHRMKKLYEKHGVFGVDDSGRTVEYEYSFR
ncbi:MAG: hypothetical protein ACLQVJ_07085 [Syntrophobacteraceae bacterium]